MSDVTPNEFMDWGMVVLTLGLVAVPLIAVIGWLLAVTAEYVRNEWKGRGR